MLIIGLHSQQETAEACILKIVCICKQPQADIWDSVLHLTLSVMTSQAMTTRSCVWHAGQATTDHAIALLANPKPFWQKSGAARVRSLANSETAVDRLLQAGVAEKLVAALSSEPPQGGSSPQLHGLIAVLPNHHCH